MEWDLAWGTNHDTTLKSKMSTLIFTGRKIVKITISGSFVTSSKLLYIIYTLDSMVCNMEGNIKLIDRLSSPSDCLIHHIYKEKTSARLNILCFICVQVHSFTTCNLHFCKKGFHAVKGPS